LIVSLGNSKQFEQAVELLYKMQHPECGGVKGRYSDRTLFLRFRLQLPLLPVLQPDAYTCSSHFKSC
jgi:hypothetical protein